MHLFSTVPLAPARVRGATQQGSAMMERCMMENVAAANARIDHLIL